MHQVPDVRLQLSVLAGRYRGPGGGTLAALRLQDGRTVQRDGLADGLLHRRVHPDRGGGSDDGRRLPRLLRSHQGVAVHAGIVLPLPSPHLRCGGGCWDLGSLQQGQGGD
ncbi:unnamed protein product [Tetraodon nigroviridis]|uniref:(spotted green pufferfish) hypothetical protein n=1 Tax=Tetraodon nigroviridis TaxID=99883 RepID=Q4S5A0_TETNG|nr:unnamed protein product [Tetraodon nigroviridis]